MLIDDDEPTNFINRMLVEESGCRAHVEIVQGGKDALDYLTRSGKYTGAPGHYPFPDLILLDINMPAMDGWEFLEQYKLLPPDAIANTIIFMLTTSLNPDDEVRAGQMPEIAGFMNKPFTADMFKQVLSDFFEGN